MPHTELPPRPDQVVTLESALAILRWHLGQGVRRVLAVLLVFGLGWLCGMSDAVGLLWRAVFGR